MKANSLTNYLTTQRTPRCSGWVPAAFGVLALVWLLAAPAFGQTWTGATSNNWLTGTNWTGNTAPNSSSAIVDILSSVNNPVMLGSSASLSTLTLGASTSLDLVAGVLSVYGASISNAGAITLDSQLQLVNNVTLSGAGSLTMVGGQFGTNGTNYTLANQSTIQGYGVIGSNVGALYQILSLNNSGTVDANSSGNTLSIQGTGASIANSHLFEATGGGILDITPTSAVNNSGGSILASGSGSTVEISTAIQGGTLSASGGGVVETVGTATLDASTQGAMTLSNGTTYTAGSGTVTKLIGALNLGTTTAGTLALGGQLELTGNTTLSGPGSLVMTSTNSSTGQIGTSGSQEVLTNQSTISGSGLIGSNASAVYPYVSLDNMGTVNANSATSGLTIGGSGTSITNAGTFEATNGGTLTLSTTNPVVNSSAIIKANGGTVDVSTTIQGGTLSTPNGGVMQTVGTAALDASTLGAISLTDGSAYTAGTGTVTKLTGALILGTTTGSTLALGGQLELTGNTTLSGPGSLVMTSTNSSTGQIGTSGSQQTLTNQITISGSGLIGSNASSVYPYVSLDNSGTVDATGGLTIGGAGTSTTNTGTFEATNGGTLTLATTNPVNNSTGNITANGGTVDVSTTIQGGTLSTPNGGVMQTVGATVLLDGATQGAITLSDGSTYTSGAGTVTKLTGQLNLGTTTGSTLALGGQLPLTGATTLSGPGSLVMTSTNSSTGQIGTSGSQEVLTNKSTISGSGLIGSNASSVYPYVILDNLGTVNANSSASGLTIGGSGTSTTNTGTFEATNGGTLTLATTNPVNNSTGNITANGGTVDVSTTIQGGTLNTSNSGVMQTAGANVLLDGLTQGAITLSDGSTYTAGTGTLTSITGTLNLGTSTGSTFDLNATAQLRLTGNATLAGPGSLTMTSSGTNLAQIGTNGILYTLTNQSTIQGAGLIGSSSGSLYPYLSLTNSGTVNAVGGTLTIAGTGTTSNSGTMAVQSASLLNITNTFSNFNSGTGTLTGGTYNVNSGTLEFNNANIVTNAADIILTGASSQIISNTSANALANFATNAAGGVFQLGAGRSFTTSGAGGGNFTNNGRLIIGAGDTFKVAGALSNFSGTTLSGGAYYVAGTLQFGASGSHLVTNSANLTLAGANPKLIDLGGNNLLTGFNTNASGASFTVAAGGSYTTPGNFSNAGTMDVEQASTLTVAGNLTNTGTVATNDQNLQGGANTLAVTGTLTNSNGASVSIGVNNDTSDVANVGLLANSGTVTVGTGATLNLTSAGTDTNSSTITLDGGTLDMQAGSFTNSSGIDLEQGGKLTINGNITNSGTITTNNANLGGAANAITVTGTLTNNNGASVTVGVNNNTADTASVALLSNAGTFTVDTGASLNLTGAGTDTNTGTITVSNGTLSLATGADLDMEEGGKLAVTGNLTNAGTISTNNANLGGSANTITVSGRLTNSSGASLIVGAHNDTTDTATLGSLTNAGSVTVGTGATLTLSTAAADTDSGSIALNGTLKTKGSLTLSGTGSITLTAGSLTATGAADTLTTGAHNTISGSGTISNFGITDAGTLSANQTAPLVILPNSAGLNNAGTLSVSTGDTMQIGTSAGGALTNFSGTTLTGGTYKINGTLQFGSSGTTIATNGANITLTGAGSRIIDFGNNNVLAGFNNNASTGIFKLASGASLTTTTGGNFINAGLFTVSTGTTFTVGGSNYTQTGGTTTVDGTLSSVTTGTLDVSAGSLLGKGSVDYNLVDAGTLTPGDSAARTGRLTVADTYTQSSTGTLDIQINGTTPVTRYDQLKVTQGATLGGTLNIALGFTPALNATFTILTASSLNSTTFTTVNGLAINSNEHFTIAYNPGSVVLTVVSGPLAVSSYSQLAHHGLERGVIGRALYGQRLQVPALAPVAPVASVTRVFTMPHAALMSFGRSARRMDLGPALAGPALSAGSDTNVANYAGVSPVSAAAYNSMSAMNHLRFECGVDLKALLKTSRKQLVKGLWAAPDSPDALYLGYMAYTGSR